MTDGRQEEAPQKKTRASREGPREQGARRARACARAQPPIARPMSSFDYCRSLIRDVPDFPKPGIVFKDITPLLASPRALHVVLDGIAERFIGEHVDAIVGIEARGFIFGGALAARLNASFVPVRKPGQAPRLGRPRRARHRVQQGRARDAQGQHPRGGARRRRRRRAGDGRHGEGRGGAREPAGRLRRRLRVRRGARRSSAGASACCPCASRAASSTDRGRAPAIAPTSRKNARDAGEECPPSRCGRRPSRARRSAAPACTGTTRARACARLRSTRTKRGRVSVSSASGEPVMPQPVSPWPLHGAFGSAPVKRVVVDGDDAGAQLLRERAAPACGSSSTRSPSGRSARRSRASIGLVGVVDDRDGQHRAERLVAS